MVKVLERFKIYKTTRYTFRKDHIPFLYLTSRPFTTISHSSITLSKYCNPHDIKDKILDKGQILLGTM